MSRVTALLALWLASTTGCFTCTLWREALCGPRLTTQPHQRWFPGRDPGLKTALGALWLTPWSLVIDGLYAPAQPWFFLAWLSRTLGPPKWPVGDRATAPGAPSTEPGSPGQGEPQ